MPSPFASALRVPNNTTSSGLGPIARKMREDYANPPKAKAGRTSDPEQDQGPAKSEILTPKRLTHFRAPDGVLKPIKSPSGAGYVVKSAGWTHPRDPETDEPVIINEKGEAKSIYDTAPVTKSQGSLWATPAGYPKKRLGPDPDFNPDVATEADQKAQLAKQKLDEKEAKAIFDDNLERLKFEVNQIDTANELQTIATKREEAKAKLVENDTAKELTLANAKLKDLEDKAKSGLIDATTLTAARADLEAKKTTAEAAASNTRTITARALDEDFKRATEKQVMSQNLEQVKLLSTGRRAAASMPAPAPPPQDAAKAAPTPSKTVSLAPASPSVQKAHNVITAPDIQNSTPPTQAEVGIKSPFGSVRADASTPGHAFDTPAFPDLDYKIRGKADVSLPGIDIRSALQGTHTKFIPDADSPDGMGWVEPPDLNKPARLTKAEKQADKDTPTEWTTPEAVAAQQAAHDIGADSIHVDDKISIKMPAPGYDKKGGLSVEGREVGVIRYTKHGTPEIELATTARGQTASPSYRSDNPFGGAPEWAAPSADHIEAIRTEADATDRDADAMINDSWQARRMPEAEFSEMIENWNGAGDHERRKLMDSATLKSMESEMPNARQLYRNGVISLQQARQLDQAVYGRRPVLPPAADSFAAWKDGDSEAAKKLRDATQGGALKSTDRQDVAMQSALVNEWADEYFKRHGDQPDFDAAAFHAEREKIASKLGTPLQRLVAGIESTGENVAGSIAGMIELADNASPQGIARMAKLKASPDLDPAKISAVQAKKAMGATLTTEEKRIDFLTQFAGGKDVDPTTITSTPTAQKSEQMWNTMVQGWKNGTRAWMKEDDNPMNRPVIPHELRGTEGADYTTAYATEKERADAHKDYLAKREAGTTSISGDIDWLREQIDNETLTAASFKQRADIIKAKATKNLGIASDEAASIAKLTKLNPQLTPAEIKAHYDETKASASTPYDVTAKSAAASLLVAYSETRDPSYLELLKDTLHETTEGQQVAAGAAAWASKNGMIQESDFLSVFNMSRRGIQLDVNEALIELAGDVTLLGAAKAFTSTSRLLKASGKAGQAVTRMSRAASKADRLLDVLKRTKDELVDAAKTIGTKPGATGRNMAVGALKTNIVATGTESGEEAMSAQLQEAKNLRKTLDQTLQGAAGGLFMGVLGTAAGAGLNALDTLAQNAQRQQAAEHFTKQWNRHNATQPITVDDAKSIRSLINPADIGSIVAYRRVVVDEISATEGPPSPDQQQRLIGSYMAEESIIRRAKEAHDELGGVGDEKMRNFIKASMRVLTGQQLTTKDQLAMQAVNAAGQPLVEQTGAGVTWTDAGLAEVAQAAPGIRLRYFPESQEQQELDAATRAAQDTSPEATATDAAPGSSQEPGSKVDPTSPTSPAKGQSGETRSNSPSSKAGGPGSSPGSGTLDHPVFTGISDKAKAREANLKSRGVQTVTVTNDKEAADFIGATLKNKGRSAFVAIKDGKPVVVFISDNIAKSKRTTESRESLVNEELHHAAALLVMQENRETMREAENEAGGIDGESFYKGYSKLSTRAKAIEAMAAYADGRWTPGAKSAIRKIVDFIVSSIVKSGTSLADSRAAAVSAIKAMSESATALLDGTTVDEAAHAAATSPTNDKAEPTDAQKEAGNYPVGKINVSGLRISIENPAGSVRKGKNKNGKAWTTTMSAHYGYLRNTIGADGDHIDVFVKEGTAEDFDGDAYVIPQYVNGKFDEHKVMIGYSSVEEAKKAYKAHYEKGWEGYRPAMRVPMSELAEMVKSGKLKKPTQRTRTNDNIPNTDRGKGSQAGNAGDNDSPPATKDSALIPGSKPGIDQSTSQPGGVIQDTRSGAIRDGSDIRPTPAYQGRGDEATAPGGADTQGQPQGAGAVPVTGGNEAAPGADGSGVPAAGQVDGLSSDDAGSGMAESESSRANTSAKESGENSVWTIRTTKGRKLSIPATEAKDEAEAIGKLAQQTQRGELLVRGSLAQPAVELGVVQQIYDIITTLAQAKGVADAKFTMSLGAMIAVAVKKHMPTLEASFEKIKVVKTDIKGGGMAVDPNTNTLIISPSTLIKSLQALPAKDMAEFIDRGFFHEYLHAVINHVVDEVDAAKFWNGLTPQAQDEFKAAYSQGGTTNLGSDSSWGHEFLRAYLENRFGKGISEEMFLSTSAFRHAVDLIKRIIARLTNIQTAIAEGADKEWMLNKVSEVSAAYIESRQNIETGNVDAQRNAKQAKAKAKPIGSSQMAKTYVNDQFGAMLKEAGVDLVANYSSISAHYVVSEGGKRRGGYIEYNPMRLAEWSPGQISDAMREEIIHALEDKALLAETLKRGYKLSDSYIQSGQYHIDFFNGVHDMMTPEQIKYVKSIYTSHGNKKYVIGSEFRRMVMQREHYGGITEQAMAGNKTPAKANAALEAVASLFSAALSILKKMMFTNSAAGRQARKIYDAAKAELERIDPRGAARALGRVDQPMASPQSQPRGRYWMDRSGNFHEVTDKDGTHGMAAERMLGKGWAEATKDLFNKGWARVVPQNEILYLDFGDGNNRATPGQMRAVSAHAEDHEYDMIVADNYNGQKTIWRSAQPMAAPSSRESVTKGDQRTKGMGAIIERERLANEVIKDGSFKGMVLGFASIPKGDAESLGYLIDSKRGTPFTRDQITAAQKEANAIRSSLPDQPKIASRPLVNPLAKREMSDDEIAMFAKALSADRSAADKLTKLVQSDLMKVLKLIAETDTVKISDLQKVVTGNRTNAPAETKAKKIYRRIRDLVGAIESPSNTPILEDGVIRTPIDKQTAIATGYRQYMAAPLIGLPANLAEVPRQRLIDELGRTFATWQEDKSIASLRAFERIGGELGRRDQKTLSFATLPNRGGISTQANGWRDSSFVASRQGVVLHSASLRSTEFVPSTSSDFEPLMALITQGPHQANAAIEAYFDGGGIKKAAAAVKAQAAIQPMAAPFTNDLQINDAKAIIAHEHSKQAFSILTSATSNLADLGFGGFQAAPTHGEIFKALTKAGVREVESVKDIDPDSVQIQGGFEHFVWTSDITGSTRAIKVMKKGNRKLDGSVTDYLTRFIIANQLLADDIRLEGVTKTGSIFISQPWINGPPGHPEQTKVWSHMVNAGWRSDRRFNTVFHSPDGRLSMEDAHNGNFVVDHEGRLWPIDALFTTKEAMDYENEKDEMIEIHGSDWRPQSLTEFWSGINSPTDLGFHIQPMAAPAQMSDFDSEEGINGILNKSGWAILTAENPQGKRLPADQNELLNENLQHDLSAAGLDHRQVVGQYEQEERPFIVIDPMMSTPKAATLARQYNQDSVLTKDGLVYQDGSLNPATGITIHDTKPDDYYTTVTTPSGKVMFTIDIDFDKKIQPMAAPADELNLGRKADPEMMRQKNVKRTGADRVAAEEERSLFMAAPSPEQIENILPGAEYISPRDAFYEVVKGPVIIGAFHGTTHAFDKFTNDRGEASNNFGKAIYATTSLDDVNANYAGVGPDLTNRINKTAERIQSENEFSDYTTSDLYEFAGSPLADSPLAWFNSLTKKKQEDIKVKYEKKNAIYEEEAIRLAMDELTSHGGAIVPLWIPSRNPLVLDKAEGDTKIQLRVDRDEYREDAIKEVMSDRGMTREEAEDSDYLYEEIDLLADGSDNIDKLKDIVDSFDGTDWGKLVDDIGYETESMNASDLEEILRTSEGTIYAEDDDGNMVNGEMVRQVFMNALGYDAIIDRNVADKFKSMKGLNAAVHIILDAEGPNRPVSALSPDHQFMAAPQPPNFVEPGFYSELRSVIASKMPGNVKTEPARTVPGRASPERTIVKDGRVLKVIKATKEADKSYPARTTAEQIKALLESADVTQEEIKWSGIATWLEGRESVTKVELLDYLDTEGSVRFKETWLNNEPSPEAMTELARARKAFAEAKAKLNMKYGSDQDIVRNNTSDEIREMQMLKYKMQAAELAANRSSMETKYAAHTLPGGKNYREIVLTQPQKTFGVSEARRRLASGEKLIGMEDGRPVQNVYAENEMGDITEFAPKESADYTSSHFSDVPNYVAHMRLDDRTDASGKQGTLIEELQSDRHQAGRKKGYKSANPEALFSSLQDKYLGIAEASTISGPDKTGIWKATINEGKQDHFGAFGKTGDAAKQNLLRHLVMKDPAYAEVRDKPISGSDERIPDAPYRSSWNLALFKRALRDAVENGMEWIGWTTGATQNERYGLEKHFNRIILQKPFSDDRIHIQGFDHDSRRNMDKIIQPSELADHVGEELATKFDAMEWKPYKTEQSNGSIIAHDSKQLTGLDLKVGGSGMIGAYDKILPAEIGRYVKQWGAKVEKGELTTPETDEQMMKRAGVNGGSRWDIDTPIWKIQITPQMRESIQTQGQPLFMAGPRHESPQAANEMLERMMAELPSAEELEVLRAMAHKESAGNRSIGVPEKANISKNEKVRVEYEVIKQIQSGDIAPEKVQEWLDEGRKMARNEDDVANQVMSNYFNGAGFDSPELVFASALVTARKFKRAQQSNDPAAMREAQALAYADGAGRTQTGRSLRAMADPHKSPHERAAEFIAKMIVTPSIKERNHIASAPSPFAKEKEIARLKAKLEALKEKIIANEKAGVGHPTQEPLVKQHKAASAELAAKVREKDRKTLIEEYTEARHKAIVEALAREGVTEEDIFVSPEERLDAQESEPVREAMQQHPQEHQDAIRYIMRGYSHADISVMTGLTKDIVAGIHQDFRQKSLRGTLAKWVKKGNTLFDTIQNGIKYVFGQSMAAPAGQMMNKQPIIAAEAEIERQLAVLCPTAKQVNGGKFSVEVVNRKSGQEVTVKVPFSPTDFRQTYRVARAISTAQSSAFDKIYEWWIMGLLSGPETNVVNVLGNAASSGVHLLTQRPLETLWNIVFRDPESAQMGEWAHIMRGIMPGIRDAFTMAALAFDAEADPIGHRYLDETMDLNFDKAGQLAKVGTYRGPSIAGKKGRIIRIPGRALMAMDSFMKSLMGNIEVGAQAYRLAKLAQARGAIANTPAELEAYIKTEVSTPGSNSWRLAMDTATELAFQDENWFSALAKHFTQRGLDARGFQKKAIDAAARGDSKTMHNMRRAANVLTFVEHAMRFIFPFVRTPTNILRMGVRKSPLGSVSLAAHIMLALGRGAYNWTGAKPFWTNQDRATLVKLFAEQTQAWFAVATLWSMIEGDDDDDDKKIILVGGRPSGTTSPGDRNEAYRNYGGTYVIIYRYPDGKEERFAFGRYEPIATALGTSIDAIREVKNMARLKRLGMEGGDATAALGNIIGSLMSQTEDKSFFQGYANLIKTIEAIRRGGDAPSDLGKGFLRQILQGIVPNIIRQPIRNIDPLVRDTKDKGDLLYSAVPLGDWAGPIIDYYGREAEKGGSSLSRLFFRSANEPLEKQPVEKWITRWNNNRPDDKFQPTDMKANDYWVYGPTGERRMIVDIKVKTDFEREVGAEILNRHNNYVATLQQSPNGKIVNSDSEDVDLKSRLTTIATEARKAVRQRFLKSPFDSVRNPVK